jgi:hypothetical protein
VASCARTTAVGASVSGYSNALGKQWSSPKTITRYDIYGPNNENFFNGGNGGTTSKLQGSNDGSAWTDLTTGDTLPGGNSATASVTSGIDVSAAYLYHRVNLNGNGTNTLNVAEVVFYEDV